MPPSDMANLIVGNRRGISPMIRSVHVIHAAAGDRAMPWMNGESLDAIGTTPLVPMCMHTAMSVSHAASHSGSQCSVENDGNPSGTGFSGNVIARAPRAAQRRTSAAISTGSHNWPMIIGMYMPGTDAHHSSISQSL